MDVVDLLKAFVATAQTGSFTSAAERLGMSNRLTSKYVGELEARIGARLLQRTTRKVGLTPAGEDLLRRAPAVLNELDDLLGSLAEQSQGFSGVLRVSAPVTFGDIYIKDLLSRFAAAHPDLTIDLHLNDTYIDLASNGIDIAFRIGYPEASSLKARKLGTITSSFVASPEYISKYGRPETLEDLQHHLCIIDTNRRGSPKWMLINNDEEIVINTPTRFMVNSASVARDWAVLGHGITLCPDFILADDVEKGRLIPLLEQFQKHTHPINAIYLGGTVLPRKVRSLIDFALEDIKKCGLLSRQ